VETYHRYIEAQKFAFGWRTKLGDMDYVQDALKIAQNITSPEYGAFVRSKITDKAHDISYYTPDHDSSVTPDHGTTNLCIVDNDGNAASATSTINLYFGAGVVSPSTGIIWNNEMDDFSTPNVSNAYGYAPSPTNFIKPGKRPQSSMSPIVIYNSTSGDVKLVAGAAGGSHIISATSQLMMQLMWFGYDAIRANEAPRLHNQYLPFVTEVESWFPKEYTDKLIERGQNLTVYTPFEVGTTVISRGNDGRIYASSDFRKGGGYPSGV